MARFLPCSCCERHVGDDAKICPFCGEPQAQCSAVGLNRWAVPLALVGALSGSSALTGCDKNGEGKPQPADEGPPESESPTRVGNPEEPEAEPTDVGNVDVGANEDTGQGEDAGQSADDAPADVDRPARIYGGPSMSSGGPPPPSPSPSPGAGEDRIDPETIPKPKYGAPRRDDPETPPPRREGT